MTLHPIPLNFLIYEENLIFFFISVEILNISNEMRTVPKLLVSSWVIKMMIKWFEKAHFVICRFCVGLVGRANYRPRIPHPSYLPFDRTALSVHPELK
jgi:hypothetical protein